MVTLAGHPALHFFDLANAIVELHEADPNAFRALPTTSGMSRRRTYYLLRVGELLRDAQITKERAEGVGWTKLQIIARHLGPASGAASADIEELLAVASEHKARDLPSALRGKRVIPRRAVQFYLNLGGRAELNEALLQFGATQGARGLKNKETALIRIVRAAAGSKDG